jgi:hypothetical protein
MPEARCFPIPSFVRTSPTARPWQYQRISCDAVTNDMLLGQTIAVGSAIDAVPHWSISLRWRQNLDGRTYRQIYFRALAKPRCPTRNDRGA